MVLLRGVQEVGSVPTSVYVDGFNLYYGALRGQPYRWLDLCEFSRRLLEPYNTITRIRYFTARVYPSQGDSGVPERQQAYLRALDTIPNLSIHLGSFLKTRGRPPKEKGSDVNLASYLLLDAFDGEYEVALVISNDSDLTLPIRKVRERFGVSVCVAAPVLNRHPDGKHRHPSTQLRQAADFLVEINKNRQRVLRDSQFPDEIAVGERRIVKPAAW